MYNEILDYIVDSIVTLDLFAKVKGENLLIGALPAGNGIAVQLGPGTTNEVFLDKGSMADIYITVNGKHTDQAILVGALESIHKYLTQLKAYPNTSEYQIVDIETNATPNYIDIEKSGEWIFGSILKLNVYIKKGGN